MVTRKDYNDVLPPNQKMAMVLAVLNITGMSSDAEIVAEGMKDDDQNVIDTFNNVCKIRRKSLHLKGNA